MKLSQNFFYTLRENVKDEDSNSGNLLVRSGLIKKSSSGVYMLLPLGLKVFNKIENIVREEMNAIGSQEVSMPSLIPEEVYIESGRRENFGKSMFALKDRNNKDFVLGPTHEELFANAAKMYIKSYKNLPFSLYQFQTKFRDEPRPRFGLIRVREFVMKDAYTFDSDLEGMNKSYDAMFNAYHRIFKRIGLNYVVVKADTGVMGGLLSEEFQALSEIGEDILVLNEDGSFSSNIEVAPCLIEETPVEEPYPKKVVDTPDAKTIEEVSAFLNQDVKKFVKTLVYKIDGQLYALLLRGDHEVNETKILKLLEATEIEMADFEEVVQATNAPVGFAGPIGLDLPIIADQQVSVMFNFTVGANEKDKHIINVNNSDFEVIHSADIRNIKEGDLTTGGQKVHFEKGIEVGNTFKLGDKYSKAMDLYYADENNKLQPVIMGSYGIGIGRCLAAIVEQHHTEKHILWPKAVTPIEVAIVIANMKDEQQVQAANQLYEALKKANIDVILDDRNERLGVKFNDMELVGAYTRITVGKGVKDNMVELKTIGQDGFDLVSLDEVVEKIKEIFEN